MKLLIGLKKRRFKVIIESDNLVVVKHIPRADYLNSALRAIIFYCVSLL